MTLRPVIAYQNSETVEYIPDLGKEIAGGLHGGEDPHQAELYTAQRPRHRAHESTRREGQRAEYYLATRPMSPSTQE